MPGTIHAFDFLDSPLEKIEGGVCAIFGSERLLKKLVAKQVVTSLSSGDAEFGSMEQNGESAEWADVADELCTVSLFGGAGPRIVIVDHADAFVKKYRERVEAYLKKPSPNGLLVLLVGTWAANTRLYKALDKSAVQVDCGPPVIKRGRSKQRDDKKIVGWIVKRAKQEYGYKLPKDGAEILIELTDCEFGRMDQELAKLALYVDDSNNLAVDDIRTVVGGWTSQTMWSAIDSATDGDADKALVLLGQLLDSGQHPLALFGQLSWSLRRYADTAEIVSRQQRSGRKVNLDAAMLEAGFQKWGGGLEDAARRLRQLGRDRVFKIYDWILETDLALKGTHSRDHRGRLMLEKLFVRMAKELGPKTVGNR